MDHIMFYLSSLSDPGHLSLKIENQHRLSRKRRTLPEYVKKSTVGKSARASSVASGREAFQQLLEQFDARAICPKCEIVKPEKSRHCNVCD